METDIHLSFFKPKTRERIHMKASRLDWYDIKAMPYNEIPALINYLNSISPSSRPWRMATKAELQDIARVDKKGRIPLGQPVYWCCSESDSHQAEGVSVSTGVVRAHNRTVELPVALVREK